MAGSDFAPAPGGLLAKKGSARPAMRRQSQVQQTGFGGGSSTLSGWLTGSDDDCGWNDMGDVASPADPQTSVSRSAIGLTAMTNSPDSLYISDSPHDPDWDEADAYDDESGDFNAPVWTPSRPDAPNAGAANPVAAMQERLQAATAAPIEAPVRVSPREAVETVEEVPVGLFGAIRAFWARMTAMILGRGPVTVLHLDYALRERLLDAAYREGLDEEAIAHRAIEEYLGAKTLKNANAASAPGMWN